MSGSIQPHGTPEVHAPYELVQWLQESSCESTTLEALEALVVGGDVGSLAFLATSNWQSFGQAIRQHWSESDHFVVRGLPTNSDGAAALLVALCLSNRFLTYNGRIMRIFRMSPWRKGLSHNIKAGDFHTDFSASDIPPAVTVIHCLEADPGGPAFGENRVALYPRLQAELQYRKQDDALAFLNMADVPMGNDVHTACWRGQLVRNGTIRYHPETVRAGSRVAGPPGQPPESVLKAIHGAALAVSETIALKAGDALFTSNLRALHYRGECTVKFVNYPADFISRRIAVFHLLDEIPQGR